MRNFSIKMLSLVAAVTLWYHVSNNVSTVTLKIPLEISNQPRDKLLLSSLDNQVQVRVKGPSFLLSSLTSNLLTLKKTLPESIESRYVVNFHPEDLELPNTVEILSIEPSQMELIFDTRVSKRVPLEVPRIGIPQFGFNVESIKAIPDTVTVVGPSSEVKLIANAETYPIDLRQIKEKIFETTLTVRKPGKLSSIVNDQVLVQVSLSRSKVSKTYKDLKINIKSEDARAHKIEPDNVTIQVSMSQEMFEKLNVDDISAYVNVPKNINSEVDLPVFVDAHKNVNVLSVNPSQVKLKIEADKKIKVKK